MQRIIVTASLLAASVAGASAATLDTVKQRGTLVCGVSTGFAGFSVPDSQGKFKGLDVDYCVASGEDLPLPDASLDCVVAVDVLEHVTDPTLVLDEIRRVLKPGGPMLFDTLNRTMLAAFTFVLLGEVVLRIVPRGTHDPAKFIKPSELRAMLLRRGFDVGSMTGLGPSGLNRLFDVTFARLPTMSLMYMGHAVKMHAGEANPALRTA